MQRFIQFIISLFAKPAVKPPYMPPQPPKQPDPAPAPTPVPVPAPTPKYDWSTIEAARHSVRLIADEEGLTVREKNDMCATIGGESEWQNYYLTGPYKGKPVIRQNMAGGKVWSTDRGICQWNDYYHSKEIPPDVAQNDNEKSVRLMCKYWLARRMNDWVAYKTGRYKAYLNVTVTGNTIHFA